jgi:hypothetical protein
MRVFVIVATRNADNIGNAIRSSNLENFELRSDAWLVASNSTTRALAESLGIRNGTNGSGLVSLMEGYSGRLPRDAWDWLSLHEAQNE